MRENEIIMSILIIITVGFIASFLHCCFYRKKRNISQTKYPRSFCDNCKESLNIIDLFPSLGYIINKGKCRKCNHKIDNTSFKTETISMLLTVMTFIVPIGYMQKILIILTLIIIMTIYTYKVEMKE